MLVDEREPVEPPALYCHLKVVAAPRPVGDGELPRVGEGLPQQVFQRVARHPSQLSLCGVLEIGLFPLELVLLPSERVPLHIFEDRYKELIGECLTRQGEFGLVLADERGLREIGTLAGVAEVLERFEDGRLNILVEGRRRFRVVALTKGRAFQTAEIEPVGDEEEDAEEADVARALEQFARLKEITSSDIGDPDPQSGPLSYQLAARVDFGAEVKQQLLEQRSEARRMHVVAELLENAVQTMTLELEVRERASHNGKVSPD